jgi:hypothetical protein
MLANMCMAPTPHDTVKSSSSDRRLLEKFVVNVQAPLPQLCTDRSTSPLLAAATSLDLPPCSHAVLGGGEGSAFHAVGCAPLLNPLGLITARFFACAAATMQPCCWCLGRCRRKHVFDVPFDSDRICKFLNS